MRRISLLLLVIVGLLSPTRAQEPDSETHRAIREAIQQLAWTSPSAMMENYAWLQQQEMPWFARDTFTMTWAMDQSNLLLLPWEQDGLAWKAIFDPVWPNGSRAPVPERFELLGKTCQGISGAGHYIQDIGFEFGLDSAFQVLEVTPLVEMRVGGYLSRPNAEVFEGTDFSECIKVTYRGEEGEKRYLVGQHHRTVEKMKARTLSEKEKLGQLLDRAVRETYAGYRILRIDVCFEADRICWYQGDALSHTIRTRGRIQAATGPKELEFEAVFHFPENEEPEVYEVRIFK